jgi:purine-nucleoside phosphorylase
MEKFSTPHISSVISDKNNEIAKNVLMPGDPLRAKFIAENFLTEIKCINEIRNMLGFTGNFNGKPVTIMGSGMGMPSIGIYSYELFNFYNVQNIIRVGSAGAINNNLAIGDVIIGLGACTNSNYTSQYNLNGIFAPIATYELVRAAQASALKLGIPVYIGNILSSDIFYDNLENLKKWDKMGVLAVEMEAAALYTNAAQAKKNAVCLLTISDCPLKGLSAAPNERQTKFLNMVKIALDMI